MSPLSGDPNAGSDSHTQATSAWEHQGAQWAGNETSSSAPGIYAARAPDSLLKWKSKVQRYFSVLKHCVPSHAFLFEMYSAMTAL